MSFKVTLKGLLSETRKLLVHGSQKMDYFKEDVYHHVSQSYSKLNQMERYEYLRELSHMHDYNKEKLFNIKSQDTTSEALRIRRMYNIKESLQPKYRDFFINLGRVPDGIKLLVDLRSDVIDIQRMISNVSSFHQEQSGGRIQANPIFSTESSNDENEDIGEENEKASLSTILQSLASPENSSNLFVLNAELKDLINVWFAGGFCQLERVTWDSSCHILQRISELEAVHPVKGWADIKRRVGAYRRCYVFTHPCMPKEPVIILHTALCASIPASIREIVQRRFSKVPDSTVDESYEDPEKINAGIFYSISSPHTGLNGINLGNTLIKRVVQTLQSEFPSLNQFSTLSPIPGFRKWLDSEIEAGLYQEVNNRIVQSDDNPNMYTCRILSPTELQVLSDYFHTTTLKDLLSRIEVQLEIISSTFSSSKSLLELADRDYQMLGWFLKSMATKYLCNEKHRGYALDNVCNFHLKNGAVVWRLNWPSDSSSRGLQNSYGVMVNYRYFIEHTETYSRQYMENKVLQMSSEVQEILQGTFLPEFMMNQRPME